ncbi:hypothetical protein BDZ91DRAFT_851489 [Kalaharituber pfeilii]|nr:hypothetical protein BDZ91DRAFT_851489 [Kalaharituber pfeilii]
MSLAARRGRQDITINVPPSSDFMHGVSAFQPALVEHEKNEVETPAEMYRLYDEYTSMRPEMIHYSDVACITTSSADSQKEQCSMVTSPSGRIRYEDITVKLVSTRNGGVEHGRQTERDYTSRTPGSRSSSVGAWSDATLHSSEPNWIGSSDVSDNIIEEIRNKHDPQVEKEYERRVNEWQIDTEGGEKKDSGDKEEDLETLLSKWEREDWEMQERVRIRNQAWEEEKQNLIRRGRYSNSRERPRRVSDSSSQSDNQSMNYFAPPSLAAPSPDSPITPPWEEDDAYEEVFKPGWHLNENAVRRLLEISLTAERRAIEEHKRYNPHAEIKTYRSGMLFGVDVSHLLENHPTYNWNETRHRY